MSSFTHDVYGIGNALMDHIVCVPDDIVRSFSLQKGQMNEMCMEKQKEVLRACDTSSLVRQGGGSAANTMVAVASLGARARYACCVGADSEGKAYVSDLSKAGVGLSHAHLVQKNQTGQTGICVVLVTPDGARTMLTHLGITKEFSVNNVDEQVLLGARYVYIEGYLVATDKGFHAMQYVRQLATQSSHAQTVLTLSDVSMVTHFRGRLLKLLGHPVDLLFCNEAEALSFTETDTLTSAIAHLKKQAHSFVITRGAKDIYAYADNELHVLPTYAARVLDTNGAGDIFAGAVLYGMTQGWPLTESIRLAAWTAARLVERIGARLDSDEWRAIKQWMKTNKSLPSA